MDAQKMTTQCCIVGGGPAGMMTGLLLARAGISVTVLEKWPDFFRDFRGDTIHPSTLTVLDELGILEEFLKLPHNKTYKISAQIGDESMPIADFSALKVKCPYLVFIPQWDFLNFIADQAKKYPSFSLQLGTSGVDLIEKEGNVVGVIAKNDQREWEIHAQIVIGADGRHSTMREKSQLPLKNIGAPMDVLWFRSSRAAGDSPESMGKIDRGHMMVMIDRGEYWQCGFIIPKGYFEQMQQQGIRAFHAEIERMMPSLSNRLSEIASWDTIKLLQVTVDRLQRWYRPGLLCIGDAAHAMSPVGGVGINLAIQDAVATANLLSTPLLQNTLSVADLASVQKRREKPTKITQRIQVIIQNRVIRGIFNQSNDKPMRVPFIVTLLKRFPWLQRIPARLIGVGVQPEHIK